MIIISGYDENYRNIGNLSSDLIEKYTKKYDFKYKIFFNKFYHKRAYSWNKVKFLLESFDEIEYDDYAMWIDADAFILNDNINIEKIFKNYNSDFLITKDINVINCGVFAVKKTNYMIDFLNNWWNKDGYETGWWENQALLDMVSINEMGIKSHLKILDQKIMNSYKYELYNMDYINGQYEDGDFILHMPNVNSNIRINIINDLLKNNDIKWDN
jgi:hypothetical protein